MNRATRSGGLFNRDWTTAQPDVRRQIPIVTPRGCGLVADHIESISTLIRDTTVMAGNLPITRSYLNSPDPTLLRQIVQRDGEIRIVVRPVGRYNRLRKRNAVVGFAKHPP